MTEPMLNNQDKTSLTMAIAILLLLLNGCHTGRYVAEEPFRAEQLKSIKKGVTTKGEIIKWFGPPAGIAGKGELVKLPLGFNETIRPEEISDFFASGHDLTENHIIYCYYYLVSTWEVLIHDLCFLINKETGLVEDYLVGKEYGKEEDEEDEGDEGEDMM